MAFDRDAELLRSLTSALAPPAAEPSAAELRALRAVIDTTPRPQASRLPGRRRRGLGVVVAVLVVGSGGTAYATSDGAPREVRSLAHAIRLPVEAPDVRDVEEALDDLEEELADGARADSVRAALAEADEELRQLSTGQRAQLEPRASSLLERAAAVLAASASAEAEERSGTGAELRDDRTGAGEPGGTEDGADGADDADDDGPTSSGSGSSGSGLSSSGLSGSDPSDADISDGSSGSGSDRSEPSDSDSSSSGSSDDVVDADDVGGSSGSGSGWTSLDDD